jgi:hypothetical protein
VFSVAYVREAVHGWLRGLHTSDYASSEDASSQEGLPVRHAMGNRSRRAWTGCSVTLGTMRGWPKKFSLSWLRYRGNTSGALPNDLLGATVEADCD